MAGLWSNIFIPNFSGGELDKTYTGRKHFGYTGYTTEARPPSVDSVLCAIRPDWIYRAGSLTRNCLVRP